MGPTCHRKEEKRPAAGEYDGWGRGVRERAVCAATWARLAGSRAEELAGLGPVGPAG